MPQRLGRILGAVFLCLAALAGCGGGDGDGGGDTAESVASSPSDVGPANGGSGDFAGTDAVPPADFEAFDGSAFAASYASTPDPGGTRVSADCTEQLAGVAGTSVFSATCDFYSTKSSSFMISTLIITGSDPETWIQCPNPSGGFAPQARLSGSQYGQTKIFDPDAKSAVLLGLSRGADPTFYAVTGGSGDKCYSIVQIGTGKDGETATSGLAHAWVATDTGTPGWCISAKAGEWQIAKSAADTCPPV